MSHELTREQAERFAQAEVNDFRERAAGQCEAIAKKREESAAEYATECPSKMALRAGATALRAAAFQIREKAHNVCYDAFASSSATTTPERKRLVYNKATKKIDVVRADGLVVDSFDPPQEHE